MVKNVDFAAGSKNVVVTPIQTADGAKVTVDVAQDLNLNSVTTKNADGSSTVVNGNGVTIKGKDGKNGASITQAGIVMQAIRRSPMLRRELMPPMLLMLAS